MRGIYRYEEDFGRMGSLSGIFTAEAEEVAAVAGRTAWLSDVLGKNSEIKISGDAIELLTTEPQALRLFDYHALATGLNPLSYIYLDTEED